MHNNRLSNLLIGNRSSIGKHGVSKSKELSLLIGKKLTKDSDSDAVPNSLDCAPFDPRRDGIKDTIKNIIKKATKPSPSTTDKVQATKDIIKKVAPTTSPTFNVNKDAGSNMPSGGSSTNTSTGTVSNNRPTSGGGGKFNKPSSPINNQQAPASPTPTPGPMSKPNAPVSIPVRQPPISSFIGSSYNKPAPTPERPTSTPTPPQSYGDDVTRRIGTNIMNAGEEVKKDFKLDVLKEKGTKFLDEAQGKIGKLFKGRESDFDKYLREYDREISNYERNVNAFNSRFSGRDLTPEEYAQAQSIAQDIEVQRRQLLAEKRYIEGRATAEEKQKERSIPTFTQNLIFGALSAPIDIARVGLGLVTSPVETVKETVTGVKNLPGEIAKRPASAGGYLAGNILGGEILTGGLGSASAATKTGSKVVKVKPRVTISGSVDEAILVKTLQSGEEVYKTTGKVRTEVRNPVTGRLANSLTTDVISESIVKPTQGGVTNIEATTGTATRTSRSTKTFGETKTTRAELGIAETKAEFRQSEINPEIMVGKARTVSKDFGTFKLRMEKGVTEQQFIKKRLSSEYETLSDIKSKVISQGPGELPISNFEFIPGERTTSASSLLSDTSKIKTRVKASSRAKAYVRRNPFINIEKGYERNIGTTFRPKVGEATKEPSTGLGFTQKQETIPKTETAVQATASSALEAISKKLKTQASKPIKVTVKTESAAKPVTTFGTSGVVTTQEESSITKTFVRSADSERVTIEPVIRDRQGVDQLSVIFTPTFEGLNISGGITNKEETTQVSGLGLSERQEQVQNPVLSTPASPRPSRPGRFRFPGEGIARRPSFILEEEKKKKTKGTQAYDVYVLRESTKPKKKFYEKIVDNVSYFVGKGIGAEETDNSVSSRFKLVKSKGNINESIRNTSWDNLQYKFREYASRKGRKIATPTVFYEKQRYRIDSPGEKSILQRARAISIRGAFGI